MRKLFKWLAFIVAILFILYILGPAPASPKYNLTLPEVPKALGNLEQYIATQEQAHKLKPDNEARIVWANDSNKQKTKYCIVYLHGFSASQEEGNPVHRNVAKALGCNLFLSRLADHGVDTSDVFANLTADAMWESAKEAVAIGKQLGEKVILLSTSTGGTLALKLCAEYPEIAINVMMSPNVELYDPNARLTNNHWGLQVARYVKNGDYNITDDQRSIYKQYWNSKYRLEGVVALEELIESTMTTATFERVKQPTLVVYYYKDEENKDKVVSIEAIKKMLTEIQTPANLKKEIAMPNVGDHVMASPIKSKDVEGVEREVLAFLKERMQ
jgi:esterase/lipase